jgi:hypothetical protein
MNSGNVLHGGLETIGQRAARGSSAMGKAAVCAQVEYASLLVAGNALIISALW